MQFEWVKPTPMDWTGQRIVTGDQAAFITKFEYTQDMIAQFVDECRGMVDSIDEGLQQQVATVEGIKDQAENLYGGLQEVQSAVESANESSSSAQNFAAEASSEADRSRDAANDSETAVQRHVDSPNPHPQYLLRSDTGGLTGKLRGTLVPIRTNLFSGFDTVEPWASLFKIGSSSSNGINCVEYKKDGDVPGRVAIFTRQVFDDVEVEALVRGGLGTNYFLPTIGIALSGDSGSENGIGLNLHRYTDIEKIVSEINYLHNGSYRYLNGSRKDIDFYENDLRYILTRIKLRKQGAELKYKVWKYGSEEPNQWDFESNYDFPSVLDSGGIGFFSASAKDFWFNVEVYWMTYKEL